MFANRSISRFISGLFAFVFMLTQVSPAYAAPGNLDPTFDGDGIAFTPALTEKGYDQGNSMVIQASAFQADSKLVMAGYSQTLSGGNEFTVVRYNDDGSLDTSFDTDGIVTIPVGGYYDQASSVAIQNNGQIVVVGQAYGPDTNYQHQFGVVRLNGNDGSLDTSFDTDGKVTTSVGEDYDFAYSVAVQSDGKIVVAGTASTPYPLSESDFAVVRYNTDGTLDTSFDMDGILTIAVGGSQDQAKSVAIQSDGQIVVAGHAYGPTTNYSYQFGVVRLNGNDGSLDTSFDTDGMLTIAIGGSQDQANSVAIQSDGQIVVAGGGYGPATSNQYRFEVVRLNASDGSLDTSFDVDGMMTTSVGGNSDDARSVAIHSDGQIVVAGYGYGPATNYSYQFGVVRLNGNDGSLDTSFDTDGKVTTNVGEDYDFAYSVAVQSDGKIVVAGTASTPYPLSESDFAVVRYNTDGTLDTSFDSDGKLTTNISMRYSSTPGLSMAIQSDDKIVMAGSLQYQSGGSEFLIARFNTDGSLDTSFGTDGMVTISIGRGYATANAVAIQSDGQILVAGGASTSYGEEFAVVRLNASDGSLDTSFDGDGIMTTSAGGTNDQANAITIQSDGQIVVAGWASSPTTNYQYHFAVVRLNVSDGSLDTSFDTDGKVTTSVSGGSYDFAYSVVVQSDGQIVVAGSVRPDNYSSFQIGVVRYNDDGSLDTSFDTDGIVIMGPSGYYDEARSVAIQSDGQIVVAGYAVGPATNYQGQFGIVRLNASDGSLDTSFDGDGIVTTSVGGYQDFAHSVAIQSDGQIVVAGQAWGSATNYNYQFGVVRLNASDGSLDTSFDTDGVVTTGPGGYNDQASTVAIQSNGKIVAAGQSIIANTNGYRFMVVRFEGGNTMPTQADQTITVNSSAPSSAINGSNFTVVATASSGLPVSYSSSGACTNIGTDFTMTSATGTCTVMYDQAGNSNYNPAPQLTEVVTALNPAPVLDAIAPVSARVDDPDLDLDINGTNFASNAIVKWRNITTNTTTNLVTTYVSSTELSAVVPSALLVNTGTFEISVFNPTPGGGTSISLPFFVTQSAASVISSDTATSTNPVGTAVASTGGSGPGTPGSITATGTGTGTVTVTIYDSNPRSTSPFRVSGKYFDVYVAQDSNFSSVNIVACNMTAFSSVRWLDSNNRWRVVNPQSYSNGCVTMNLSNTSLPKISQLTGTIFGVEESPVKNIVLIDSQGGGLEGATAQYYSNGWKNIPGSTDTYGILPYDGLGLSGNITFRITYANASVQKQQNVTNNPEVTFQTQLVSMQLLASNGSTGLNGDAQYYSNGWLTFGSGTTNTTMELLPVNYTFRVSYGGASVQKQQNIGNDSTVVFQTKSVSMQLLASNGTTELNGSAEYYANGWKTFGDGSTSTMMELLPVNYTFRVSYGGASIQKQQDVNTNAAVVFQTKLASMQLLASNGTTELSGTSEYYASGWKTFGNGSTTTTMELLPVSYTFRVTYGGAGVQKQQDVNTNSLIVFQTKLVTMKLLASNGTTELVGTSEYYANGWKTFGNGTTTTTMELLPVNYTFRVSYGGASVQKQQDANANQLVVFQTGQVRSNSASATQYYANGWKAFVQNIELLPGSYPFKFNDGTLQTTYALIAGAINNIH